MGTTVFGGLGPGLGQTVNPFDPDWIRRQTIAKQQQIADRDNAAKAAQYLGKAHDYLAQNVQLQAAGKALLTLEAPPFKEVVDGSGNIVASTEFVTSPVSVIPPQGAAPVQFGPAVQAANAPPDRLDQVIAILAYLGEQLAAIRAKLGA